MANSNSSTFTSATSIDENGEMTFQIQERERRFTTITLREIRYPTGCPCHPKDPEAMRKYQQSRRAPSPDARPPPFLGHSRPELTHRPDSHDSRSSNGSGQSRSIGSFLRRLSSD